MFSSEGNELTALQAALTHSQSWVELHANQRQNLLNFFLIAIAFLFNAYVGALNGQRAFLAAVISLLGVAISFSFTMMDLRNRDLTRAGEIAIRDLEDRLAHAHNMPSLRIMETIDEPRHPWLSIGKLIRAIHLSVGFVFLGATIYALIVA